MKRTSLLLTTLLLLLVMGVATIVAQEQEIEPAAPPPPRDGAVAGVIAHTVQETIGNDGATITEKGRFGQVEHTVTLMVPDSMLDSSVHWSMRSRLQYYDHGNWEEVQAASDNWTDTEVYQLRVVGELFQNGSRQWSSGLVSSCCNVTYVSSGFSPWHTGYNAFWQSKGTHFMQVTPGSDWVVRDTEVSRQF